MVSMTLNSLHNVPYGALTLKALLFFFEVLPSRTRVPLPRAPRELRVLATRTPDLEEPRIYLLGLKSSFGVCGHFWNESIDAKILLRRPQLFNVVSGSDTRVWTAHVSCKAARSDNIVTNSEALVC